MTKARLFKLYIWYGSTAFVVDLMIFTILILAWRRLTRINGILLYKGDERLPGLIKRKDPPADLTGCHAGTVNSNLQRKAIFAKYVLMPLLSSP